MSVQITYFVHGTTTDNEAKLATGWLPGKLSQAGRNQATDLGKQVADTKFDMVFCSDLQRAIESAKRGFGGTYQIIEDGRLRECNYGDYNGQPAKLFKDNLLNCVTVPFPNDESYCDVEERMRSFLAMLDEQYTGKHIAIVAHQAPQLALDVILGGRSWEQAIAGDWRLRGAWQPGWEYKLV